MSCVVLTAFLLCTVSLSLQKSPEMTTKPAANFEVDIQPGIYYGIVKIREENSKEFVAVCARNFDQKAVNVVCREKGYIGGRLLQQGAFGAVDTQYALPGLSCNGNETKLKDCSNSWVACGAGYSMTYYAAVLCYRSNVTYNDSFTYTIPMHTGAKAVGPIIVTRYGLQGSICPDKWTDIDAGVACKETFPAMPMGKVFTFKKIPYYMFHFSKMNCTARDQLLSTCSYDKQFTPCDEGYFESGYAGVLCYSEQQVPTIALKGGKKRRGRVEIIYTGVPGTVCDNYDKNRSPGLADIVCHKMLSYTYGEIVQDHWFGKGSGDVYLENSECMGQEDTIYQCKNLEWNSTSKTCRTHDHDLAVVCYSDVRLIEGSRTKDIFTGLAQVHNNKSDIWDFLCSNTINSNESSSICRELEFDNGIKLEANMFKPQKWDSTHHLVMLQCPSAADDISKCTRVSTSYCFYAGIACWNNGAKINGDVKLVPFDNIQYYGAMRVHMYGIDGYLCPGGLRDMEAGVFCRGVGYAGGYIAYMRNSSNAKILLTGVRCNKNSTDIYSCNLTTWNSCTYNNRVGTAFCYSVEPKMVIARTTKKIVGEVRLQIEGEWGTICAPKYPRSYYLARVICIQLGYMHGTPMKTSPLADTPSQMWMKGINCRLSDTSVFGCPFESINATGAGCDPFHVQCYSKVVIGRGDDSSGMVQLYIPYRYSYRFICADGFTDREATAICQENGYKYGRALNGSAAGSQPYYLITVTKFKCSEETVGVNNCTYSTFRYCPSDEYASVACSNTMVGKDYYTLRISNKNHGVVVLKHFFAEGFICGDHFDHKAASVICTEAGSGFTSGIAYRTNNIGKLRKLMWLRDIKCRGDEDLMGKCNRSAWGDVRKCGKSMAGVICYSATDSYQIQLQGPAFRRGMEGRLEMRISGSWATVCSLKVTHIEATVACREMGYQYGRVVQGRTYTPVSTSEFTVFGLVCKGKEKRIADCYIAGFKPNATGFCSGHQNDVSMFCYHSTRLNGGTFYNYGRLEILSSNGVWSYLSDQGVNNNGARVACRYMGFMDGITQCCGKYDGLPEVRKIPVIPYKFDCYGSESYLEGCKNSSLVNVNTAKGMNVLCLEEELSKNVTLVDDAHHFQSGPVRIKQGELKMYVCLTQWDDNAASVICKQKGFSGGVAQYASARLSSPYFVGNINCNGSETNINACQVYQSQANVACDTIYKPSDSVLPVAGFLCFNKGKLQYRLKDGVSDLKGRAEIRYNSHWGTICSLGMSLFEQRLAAMMFCRSMGKDYPDGYMTPYNVTVKKPAAGDTPIYLTDISCTGKEKTLLSCRHKWVLGEQIGACLKHGHDLAVTCFRSVRLVRGNGSYGIVHISNKYIKWRTICSDGFNDTDARVACQPNYKHGLSLCCGAFGFNFVPASWTNIRCDGSEVSLQNCKYTRVLPISQCYRNDYAAVLCYNGTLPPTYDNLKLYGTNQTGSILMNYMGVYGSICADGWNDVAAKVACRELGHPSGEMYIHYREKYVFHTQYGPYWATKVGCSGSEKSLKGCKLNLHNIKQCVTKHHAGVLCYDKDGIDFRLAGSKSRRKGRVEARVNGEWGSVCHTFWNHPDARVLCTQLGYDDGLAVLTRYPNVTKRMWQPKLRCTGNEKNLKQCPHSGWHISLHIGCFSAAVVCFKSVALQSGHKATHGPLLIRVPNSVKGHEWQLVCDGKFNDAAARLACIELGFNDGKAICCSAYANNKFRSTYRIAVNYTLTCSDSESTIDQCIVRRACGSKNYASVICLDSTQSTDDKTSYRIEDNYKERGHVVVKQFGVEGRICSKDWGDQDARVVCRASGYAEGISYDHHNLYESFDVYKRGPFLKSNFICSGSEKSLRGCVKNDRLNLGDCSSADIAGVVCYNGTGIKYRLVYTNKSLKDRGRVEVSVDGVWGTVCSTWWSNNDANVFCNSQGFGGGVVMTDPTGKRGNGPIWLSHLLCRGNETYLHKCSHRGFNASITDVVLIHTPTGQRIVVRACRTHRTDAAVRCYGNLRLSRGVDASMGAVERYNTKSKSWYTVCDSNWENHHAELACNHFGFRHGIHVPYSSFRNQSTFGPTRYKITCSPNDKTFEFCKAQILKANCSYYASVYCLNTPPKKQFALKLSNDSYSGRTYGMLEVNIGGMWGRICHHGWRQINSDIACRTLGFKGGVTYLHALHYYTPIAMISVKCTGNETNLSACPYLKWTRTGERCHFLSYAVGVICHEKSRGAPALSLAGGINKNEGRVEMVIDGVNGKFCDYDWDSNDALVVCRSLGYVDGYAHRGSKHGAGPSVTWINRVLCRGTEDSLLQCVSSGYKSKSYAAYCQDSQHTASVSCYENRKTITKIRLRNLNSPSESFGRVEVLVDGPNLWGTVCDDNWDVADATVVCRQLGFARGEATRRAKFGVGSGPIWTSEVACKGSEKRLSDCKMLRLGMTKCVHSEDAGVVCHGKVTTPSSKSTPRLSKSTMIPWSSSHFTFSSTFTSSHPPPKPTIKPSPRAGTGKSQPSTIVPAVVVPIVIIILIAVIGILVFFMFRRRLGPFAHKRLDEDVNQIKYNPDDDFVNIKSDSYPVNEINGMTEITNPHYYNVLEDVKKEPPTDFDFGTGFSETSLDAGVDDGYSAVNPMFGYSDGHTDA